MKRWKDIPGNEKWMILVILLLLAGILLRWNSVREGIDRGFRWYRSAPAKEPVPADSAPENRADTIPPDVEK